MTDPEFPPTADQPHFLTNAAQLRRWFPWLRIFRSARFAVDYQILFLSLLAVMIWVMALRGTDRLFSAPKGASPATPSEQARHVLSGHEQELEALASIFGDHSLDALSTRQQLPWNSLELQDFEFRGVQISDEADHLGTSGTTSLLFPMANVTGAAIRTVRPGTFFHGLIEVVVGLLICGLFGGSVSRMAAREFTSNRRWIKRDLQFSARQLPMAVLAPLIPTIVLAILWTLCFITGWLGRIPFLGQWGLVLAWFPILLCSFVMSLILLGVLIGWPMMFVSSSVERNDSFDAFSRTFSYLWNRAWYAIFLILIAGIFGWVTLAIVQWMSELTLLLALRSVGSGLGSAAASADWNSLRELVNQPILNNPASWASQAIHFGSHFVGLLPTAYAFSYFWCSLTVIYFLLRQAEDGTPLDVIDLSDSPKRNPTDLPLVGVPAAEHREAQLKKAERNPTEEATPAASPTAELPENDQTI